MNTASSGPVDTAASLLKAAESLVIAGNLQAADPLLQRALALEPSNVPVRYNAAIVAFNLGRREEGLNILHRVVRENTQLPYFSAFADMLKTTEQFDAASRYYTAILAQVPNHASALAGLADIYDQTGYSSLALECYEKALALAPRDKHFLRRISKLVPYKHVDRTYNAYLKARLPQSSPGMARIEIEGPLVTWKECVERAKRGLPANAQTPDEMFFTFAQKEFDAYEAEIDEMLVGDSTNNFLAVLKASCLIARGKRKDAQKYYDIRKAAQPQSIYANVVFDDALYQRLEAEGDSELTDGLPPLEKVLSPAFADAPIIFFSCDSRYYLKFVRTMLLSIDDVVDKSRPQKLQVHVHIMDASREEIAEALAFCAKLLNTSVAITAEHPSARAKGEVSARAYFHAIRFVRMYQIAVEYQKPLWMMDVDGLMHRDPRVVFDGIGTADIALYGHPARWEPWMQYNASMVGIRPTEKAVAYLRLVAGYIRHFHRRNELYWGIDQLAMYAVLEFLRDQGRGPSVIMLTALIIDGECSDEGIVWGTGPLKKMPKAFVPAGGGAPDSPLILYAETWRKYDKRLAELS